MTDWTPQWDWMRERGCLRAGDLGQVAAHLRLGAVFLATPWCGYDSTPCHFPELRRRHQRRDAADWAARLCDAGICAVSPVLAAAPVSQLWCRKLLRGCAAVAVPEIRGWDASLLVWEAVSGAVAAGTPVHLIRETEVL